MGGYSGGQGNSLQNSSAASAANELSSENTVTTGSKVFNITNKGTGINPWLAVIALLVLAGGVVLLARR
jgi:hypothetical protein